MAVHVIEHGDDELAPFFTEVIFGVSISDVAEEAPEEVTAELFGGGNFIHREDRMGLNPRRTLQFHWVPPMKCTLQPASVTARTSRAL